MPQIDVNIWAVLLCVVISMVLGMVWYNPKVFGNAWMKEAGKSMEDIEAAKKKGMTLSYLLAMVGSFLTAYVMRHVLGYAGAETMANGLETAVWMWIGFVAPVMLHSVIWDGKSWKYFTITSGYQLVQLLIFGAVLVSWQ